MANSWQIQFAKFAIANLPWQIEFAIRGKLVSWQIHGKLLFRENSGEFLRTKILELLFSQRVFCTMHLEVQMAASRVARASH